ncbi:MAG: FRG domain-containing protein [Caldilineaceae bacterium]|nr:FRG domain-containing protein [Caldilineaceae bacterium]
MNNSKFIYVLVNEGVESWNAKRRDAQRILMNMEAEDPDFLYPELSNVNLSYEFMFSEDVNHNVPFNLAGIDLSETILTNSTLNNFDLAHADLSASGLDKTKFIKATLTKASFHSSDLKNACLNEADLSGADFRNATLESADLTDATLTDANLTTTNLLGANLSGTSPWKAELFDPDNESPKQNTRQTGNVRSISDLLDEVRTLRQHHDKLNENVSFYFRGESSCNWTLRPSVMRRKFTLSESEMIIELMSRRPEEFNSLPSSLAQWMLAQHHGLKTRFLDVTRNPMVALFHACEADSSHDDEYARLHVFAVPRSLIKPFNSDIASIISNFAKLSSFEQNLLLGRKVIVKDIVYRAYPKIPDPFTETINRLHQFVQEEKQSFQNRIDVKDFFRVFVVEPQQLSDRVRAQASAFLVSAFHERFERDEIERLTPGVPIYAHYMLSIPFEDKPNIIEDLRLINVSRETLYPGLDEAANSIIQSSCSSPPIDPSCAHS